MQHDRPSEVIAKRLEKEARRMRHEAALSAFIVRDRLIEHAEVMDRAAQIAREEH